MNELLKQKGLCTGKFTARTNEEDDAQWRRSQTKNNNEVQRELRHPNLVFPLYTKGDNASSWIEDCDEAIYDGTPIYEENVEAPVYDCPFTFNATPQDEGERVENGGESDYINPPIYDEEELLFDDETLGNDYVQQVKSAAEPHSNQGLLETQSQKVDNQETRQGWIPSLQLEKSNYHGPLKVNGNPEYSGTLKNDEDLWYSVFDEEPKVDTSQDKQLLYAISVKGQQQPLIMKPSQDSASHKGSLQTGTLNSPFKESMSSPRTEYMQSRNKRPATPWEGKCAVEPGALETQDVKQGPSEVAENLQPIILEIPKQRTRQWEKTIYPEDANFIIKIGKPLTFKTVEYKNTLTQKGWYATPAPWRDKIKMSLQHFFLEDNLDDHHFSMKNQLEINTIYFDLQEAPFHWNAISKRNDHVKAVIYALNVQEAALSSVGNEKVRVLLLLNAIYLSYGFKIVALLVHFLLRDDHQWKFPAVETFEEVKRALINLIQEGLQPETKSFAIKTGHSWRKILVVAEIVQVIEMTNKEKMRNKEELKLVLRVPS